MLEFEWSVSEWKFDYVSEKLGRPFDMHQLNHITEELFFNPNNHIDIIRTLGAEIGRLREKEEDCEQCLHSPPPIPPGVYIPVPQGKSNDYVKGYRIGYISCKDLANNNNNNNNDTDANEISDICHGYSDDWCHGWQDGYNQRWNS
jgi:hypothetical protein